MSGGMSVGGATVAIIKAKWGGMQCEAYPSELQAVLGMMDRGTLGKDGCHGSEAHLAALQEVEKELGRIRERIKARAAMDALEAMRDQGPDLEVGDL